MKVHGNLKSSNIVVDGRFQCKLTDISLRTLASGEDEDVDASEYSQIKGSNTEKRRCTLTTDTRVLLLYFKFTLTEPAQDVVTFTLGDTASGKIEL